MVGVGKQALVLFAVALLSCVSCGNGGQLTSDTLVDQDINASWRSNLLARHIVEPATFGPETSFVEVTELKTSQPREATPQEEACSVEPLGSFKGIEGLFKTGEDDILLQVRTAPEDEIKGFFDSSEKLQTCTRSEQTEKPVKVEGADRTFQTTFSLENSDTILSEMVAAQFEDKLIILIRTGPNEKANLQELADWVATSSRN